MPLMVAFAGWTIFGDRLKPQAALGLALGIAGGVTLIMGGSRLSGGVDVTGVVLCFIAAAALTIATLSVRTASSGGNLMMIVGLQMFVGAFALAIASAVLETPQVTWSWQLGVAFTYTVLGGPGLLATWIWFALVTRVGGAVRAATFHFLNPPFFGVAVAAVLLGEALGWLDGGVGVAVITLGILLVQLAKQNPPTQS